MRSFTAFLLVILASTLMVAQRPQVPPNEMENLQNPALHLSGSAQTTWYNKYTAWAFGVMQQLDGSPHYDMGASPGMIPGVSQWNMYIDSQGEYSPNNYWTVYEAADAPTHGFNPEKAFIHYSIDFQTYCTVGRTNCYLQPYIDEFDAFESPFTDTTYGYSNYEYTRNPYYAIHGAWNCVGTVGSATCTDVTRAAYCPAPQPSYLGSLCENATASPITMTDHMLLGRQLPFYVINVKVNTGRVGGGVTYKYWDGTQYSTLTTTSDTTGQLATSGAISFVPPGGWKRNSDADATTAINASAVDIQNCWTPGTAVRSNKIDCPKFHVIMQLTGTVTTNPVIGRVWSDNGLTPIATETASTVAISHSGSTYTATIVTSGTNVFTTVGQQVLLSGFSTVGLNGQWNAITAASNSSQIVTTWTVCTTAGCPADQAATADAGTAVVYQNRGWGALAGATGGTACQHTVANASDPELAYCDLPGTGSSAHIPGEARYLTGFTGGWNQVQGNQLFDSISGEYPWAYAKAQEVAVATSLGDNASGKINGVWWDDIAGCPQYADWTKTETAGVGCNTVSSTFFPILNTIIHTLYSGYKNQGNINHYYNSFGPGNSLDGVHLEQASVTWDQTTPDTDTALAICTDQTWCSKTTICPDALTNPSSTCKAAASSFQTDGTTVAFYYGQYPNLKMAGTHLDKFQWALLDGKSVYHTWDMGNQGPIAALAMWHLIKNPNVLFNYQSIDNTVEAGGDDYMVWTVSPSTLFQSLSAGTTCTACTITLSGAVDTPAPLKPCTQTISNICGIWHTSDSPIRITNVSGQWDILPMGSYTVNGSNQLTGSTNAGTVGIVHNHAIGDRIEYMVQNFESQKNWQTNSWATPAFRTTAQDSSVYGNWSYHVPASDIYLGVPDVTNGFDAPCRYSTNDRATAPGAALKDCQWIDGPTISGDNTKCDAVAHSGGLGVCAALVRRDYKNGSYGKAIVLLRPSSNSTDYNYTTASNEYDQASQTITLPGTSPYYRLNADGTIDPTPITTLTLKGREGFIGVTQPGGVPNISSGVTISGGGVVR